MKIVIFIVILLHSSVVT